MHVLVTGGAGFVGSHLVDRLVARGDRVRVLDALDPSVHAAAPSLPDGVELIRGDLTDAAVVERACRGVDAVSHQAAMVGLGADYDDVVDYVRTNSLGTATLLQSLHRVGFSGPFVLASSMVVYGEGGYFCQRHGTIRPAPRSLAQLSAGAFDPVCPECCEALAPFAVTEDAPLDPRNVYAATKVHQEHLCATFAQSHDGVALTVLRYHNVYGPRMPRDTPYAGVASIFRSAVARRECPRVLEDGQQLRDFVHVRDVARANELALCSDASAAAGVFNVASGSPRTVLELAAAVVAAGGNPALEPVVVGGGRPGDVRHVFASAQRARDVLGFVAAVDFEVGTREFATASMR